MSTSIMAELERACRFADRGDTVSVVGTLHVAMQQLAALDQQAAALRRWVESQVYTRRPDRVACWCTPSDVAAHYPDHGYSCSQARALLAPPAAEGGD